MEDERIINPVSDNIIDQGVVRYLRDALPAHCLIKLESFSMLKNLGIEKYESATFHASDHTWRLILYPNGNAKRGGTGHISLYLAITNGRLPPGWEVYVTYKMFVYNHHKDKYLTIQEVLFGIPICRSITNEVILRAFMVEDDPAHQIIRFHQAKKESGYDRLISLDTFNSATNGYLIDDSCLFGVEVHRVKYNGKGEVFKMIKNTIDITFNWKIPNFSAICRDKLDSEEFSDGDGNYTWRLTLEYIESKESLSLYLRLVESPETVKRVLADFTLVVKNQKYNHHHIWLGGDTWFTCKDLSSDVASRSWGVDELISLSKLETESEGFILNDTLLLQAKVEMKAEITNFS